MKNPQDKIPKLDIKTLGEDNNVFIENVVNSVKNHGCVIIENAFSIVEESRDDIKKFLKENGDHDYNFGIAYKNGNVRSVCQNIKGLSEIIEKSWIEKVAQRYWPASHLIDIFITHEFKSTQNLAANGKLHFDKLNTLKFMFYLTDTDKNSGAFSVSPNSHLLGAQLRNNTWKNAKLYAGGGDQYSLVKNKVNEEFNLKKETYPIESKSGTIIVFDTDIFHMGGVVQPGKERLLARLHYSDGRGDECKKIKPWKQKMIERSLDDRH